MVRVGVYVNSIKGFDSHISTACNSHTLIGYYDNCDPVYFDEFADADFAK